MKLTRIIKVRHRNFPDFARTTELEFARRAQAAGGLSPIRNKVSDGRARERKPELHDARTTANAPKVVATCLVGSHLGQRERGIIARPPRSINGVERTSGGAA